MQLLTVSYSILEGGGCVSPSGDGTINCLPAAQADYGAHLGGYLGAWAVHWKLGTPGSQKIIVTATGLSPDTLSATATP